MHKLAEKEWYVKSADRLLGMARTSEHSIYWKLAEEK